MRLAAVVFALLAIAAPAAAQVAPAEPLTPRERLGQLEARQAAQNELDRQRGVEQQNQLNSLDARVRTERSLANVKTQSNLPRLVPPSYTQGTPTPVEGTPAAGTKGAADIPDAVLQDSNQKVRDAADNRH